MQADKIVRRWVTTCPGGFSGPDHTAVLREAYAAAGMSSHMALSEFADALARMGHRVQCVRDGLYRLNLPDGKSPGVKARIYHD